MKARIGMREKNMARPVGDIGVQILWEYKSSFGSRRETSIEFLVLNESSLKTN